MGPTASGKTGVAVELVRRLPLEIISVDSALVYRYMNIGTAKPDIATLAAAPHHLIDLIDPTESYSAAQFREDALRVMHDITARGKIPFLVGGTMLYFKALREGLDNLPKADATVRANIAARATASGWPVLHAALARVDPDTAARVNPNDAQRIGRALEIYELTGQPMSRFFKASPADVFPYRGLPISLMPSDRAVLHARIEQRFDSMLRHGLVEEVASLRARFDLDPQLPAMRCVGYRQAWQYQEGAIGRDELRDRGIFATRQLAKRQMTWLRGMSDTLVIDCLADNLVERVEEAVRRFLSA
jgi:tRNA dimethylallyltransferase